VPAETPNQYWRRAIYLPFIDHLLQELNSRLISNENRFCAQYLIPTKLDGLTREITNTVFETFRDDLPANDVEQFQEEVDRWLVRWNIVANPTPSAISETLAVINCELYPNIYVCLLVLVTMPVTTATAERSFSVMRRVKTYVRSTMLTERLSALAVLHAYKHWHIDVEKVIDVFAVKKTRRLGFLFAADPDIEAHSDNE